MTEIVVATAGSFLVGFIASYVTACVASGVRLTPWFLWGWRRRMAQSHKATPTRLNEEGADRGR